MPDDMGNLMHFRRPGNAWMGELQRGESGPYATVANAVLVMGCDAEIAGTVAYDEFSHRIVMTRPPPAAFTDAPTLPGPYPRSIGDTDVTMLQGYIQRAYGMRISQLVAQQAVVASADLNRIHPVRDWLDGLAWDGIPRVDDWLHNAFGAPQDAYHRAIAVKVLCAAIRRVRSPGCKFDYVLVLQGPQGKGKSRACRALFGADWFTDNLPHDLTSKDAQQGMAGKWGIELGELNALIRTTNQAAKAFFSRQVDHYRPPYGKSFVERPRQCVFFGTTNDADFLSDPTGNRRYWPVLCDKCEVEWIAEARDQLWAEAAQIEAGGEPLWLDDERVQVVAADQQSQRMPEDVWAAAVWTWVEESGRDLIRVPDVLHFGLGLQRAQQTRAAEMRVAAILRGDGWLRHRHKDNGKTVISWVAPGAEVPGRPGIRNPKGEASGGN